MHSDAVCFPPATRRRYGGKRGTTAGACAPRRQAQRQGRTMYLRTPTASLSARSLDPHPGAGSNRGPSARSASRCACTGPGRAPASASVPTAPTMMTTTRGSRPPGPRRPVRTSAPKRSGRSKRHPGPRRGGGSCRCGGAGTWHLGRSEKWLRRRRHGTGATPRRGRAGSRSHARCRHMQEVTWHFHFARASCRRCPSCCPRRALLPATPWGSRALRRPHRR
mmetsp:Transcript_39682/g.114162  ORF Transcript_39682/g.114162 Transcript_39682/m.114162 type:complete len:222 (+) Transcript_39682:420-1085(+)